MVMLVAARPEHAQRYWRRIAWSMPVTALHEYIDGFGNRCWRLVGQPGRRFGSVYDAADRCLRLILIHCTPARRRRRCEELPDDTLAFTLPSRHCQSDLLWMRHGSCLAARRPAGTRAGHMRLGPSDIFAYKKGSIYTTSAYDVYHARAGVCRDFAHLGVTFCRALNVPPAISSATFPMPGSWRLMNRWISMPGSRPLSMASGAPSMLAITSPASGAFQLAGDAMPWMWRWRRAMVRYGCNGCRSGRTKWKYGECGVSGLSVVADENRAGRRCEPTVWKQEVERPPLKDIPTMLDHEAWIGPPWTHFLSDPSAFRTNTPALSTICASVW